MEHIVSYLMALLAEAGVGDQPFSHAAEVRHVGMSEGWRTWRYPTPHATLHHLFFRAVIRVAAMIICLSLDS